MKYRNKAIKFVNRKSTINAVGYTITNEIVLSQIAKMYEYLDSDDCMLKKQNCELRLLEMLAVGVEALFKQRLIRMSRYTSNKYTLYRCVIKYGKIAGLNKWNEYRKTQAETNTLEYKKKHHNMTDDEFRQYNLSRSVTLNNCIKRHGEYEGTRIFTEYCEKQKTAGTSLDYFVCKYGSTKGKEKYLEVCSQKGATFQNSMRVCGGDETKALKHLIHRSGYGFVSKQSQDLFCSVVARIDIDYDVYYADKNKEYVIYDKENDKIQCYDFTIPELNIIIEYNGDWYHANPKIYNSGDKLNWFSGEKMLVDEIWEKDKTRAMIAKKLEGFSTFTIWEHDFVNNREETIDKCVGIINDKLRTL